MIRKSQKEIESNRRKRIKEFCPVLRQKAFEYAGGKCVDCGLKTDIIFMYDYHHVVFPKGKDLGRMISKPCSWKIIKAEVDKCVLLCANCHRVRHYKEGFKQQNELFEMAEIVEYPLFANTEEASA